jgi:hypothetical protein
MYIDLIPAQLYKYVYDIDGAMRTGVFQKWKKGEYLYDNSKIQSKGTLLIVDVDALSVIFLPIETDHVVWTTRYFFLRNFSLERIK